VTVAAIGPVTAQTAMDNGLTVQVVPESYTIAGLVEALIDFYNKQGSSQITTVGFRI
jgi:uroporphyrinogen-III synthase